MLSACDSTDDEIPTIATRLCPEFSHPDLTSWIPETEGDITSFSNDAGETALFTSGELVLNMPFTERGDPGQLQNDISCRLVAERLVTSSSLYPQFTYEYTYSDITNLSTQDEPLRLTISLSSDEGESLSQLFGFDLANGVVPEGRHPLHETQYFPTLVINNNSYANVISQSLMSHIAQLLSDTDQTAEQNIVKVLVARGVGLIQFELADGRIYSRNP